MWRDERDAEVTQSGLGVCDEHVGGLEIPMHHILIVTVIHATRDLLADPDELTQLLCM